MNFTHLIQNTKSDEQINKGDYKGEDGLMHRKRDGV